METKNVLNAIGEFQKECPAISKGKENPYFKSKYADLTGIYEVIKDLLVKNHLVILQPLSDDKLKTIVYHSVSGESVEYEVSLPAEINPQKMGSAITYYRRYSIVSFLNIITDDDDDGNIASGKSDVKKYPKSAPVKTAPTKPAPKKIDVEQLDFLASQMTLEEKNKVKAHFGFKEREDYHYLNPILVAECLENIRKEKK